MSYAIIREYSRQYIYVHPKILREKRILSLNREQQYSYKKGVSLKCIGMAKEHGLQ